MSKSFENEYREYAKNNVPDLWSRIEAGIDALEDAQETDSNDNIEITEATNQSRATVKKQPVITAFRKYSGLLVACAAAAIVIPSFIIISRQTARSNETMSAPMSDSSATMETAAEDFETFEAPSYDMTDDEVYEADEAPVAAEEAYEETSEEVYAESACAEEACEDASEATNFQSNLAAVRSKSVSGATTADNAADDIRIFEGLQSGDILCEVEYTIVSKNDDGTYLISIVNDPNGYLEPNEQICVSAAVSQEDLLSAQNVLNGDSIVQSTLQYMDDAEIPFIISTDTEIEK